MCNGHVHGHDDMGMGMGVDLDGWMYGRGHVHDGMGVDLDGWMYVLGHVHDGMGMPCACTCMTHPSLFVPLLKNQKKQNLQAGSFKTKTNCSFCFLREGKNKSQEIATKRQKTKQTNK
jgi:hypothetical protein